MQGEGQEFESPRLHHRRLVPARRAKSNRSGPIPDVQHSPRDHARIEPLIRALPERQATDQRIAGGGPISIDPARGASSGGPHLNNWKSFGRLNESSISPSSQYRKIPIRSQSATGRLVRGWRGSSYKGHGVDALAPRADEGRGRLRKAPGSREQTSIRRCPNGETRLEKASSPLVESNRPGGGKPAN